MPLHDWKSVSYTHLDVYKRQVIGMVSPEAQAVAAADTIPITVYNDSISVADDFKMERAARLFAKYDLSRDRCV